MKTTLTYFQLQALKLLLLMAALVGFTLNTTLGILMILGCTICLFRWNKIYKDSQGE